MTRDEFYALVSAFGAQPFPDELYPIMAEYDRLTIAAKAWKKAARHFYVYRDFYRLLKEKTQRMAATNAELTAINADLLAACKRAKQYVDDVAMQSFDYGDPDLSSVLADAIAKARGA